MNESVQRAVEEIRERFPENKAIVQDDNSGGAQLIIEEIPIGDLYRPSISWFGFRITFQYPNADVYPHFIRGDLIRNDNRPFGDGITGGHTFFGRQALQLSRKSNRLNANMDTAYIKLMKVIEWLKKHP